MVLNLTSIKHLTAERKSQPARSTTSTSPPASVRFLAPRHRNTRHPITPSTTKTNTPAAIGATTATIDITTAHTLSAAETIGFPIPAVVTVETARVATLVACTAPASPPPATIAAAHRNIGPALPPTSTNCDPATIDPATTAAGEATTSNAWSSHGTQYATTSSSDAVANATIAASDPIHDIPDPKLTCPARAATARTSSGTNTLNPHAAASPSPTITPSTVS